MKGWATLVLVTTLPLLLSCERQNADSTPPGSQAIAAQTYGEAHNSDGPIVPLAKIAANPTRYEGQQVRTEGEIERVCQKRGCWLELTDGTGAQAFVPMARHAFVVPMDSVGREVLVEGTVHVRERSEAERKHLEADGAGDRIPALSINANAVVILTRSTSPSAH